MRLDAESCYRALTARDVRFDGIFFTAVKSTGIYCRPVCPARTPRRDRCRFFPSAAAAERNGFRPCLRCRPELAPGIAIAPQTAASVDAVAALAEVAAVRIGAGALDEQGVDSLAAELGVSARHLRRAVGRTLGATPVELAQTHRLLMAKRLLTDTPLPVTQVMLASGFQSLRRFNALIRARYARSPSELRRSSAVGESGSVSDTLHLTLAYRPPLAWDELLSFLAIRATPGVEHVAHGSYSRTLAIDGHGGSVTVSYKKGSTRTLDVALSASLLPVLPSALARIRNLFDLDAEPHTIDRQLSEDNALTSLVVRRPGMRVPGAVDGFELALRAVLGQQVSVRAATTIAGRLAELLGERVPRAHASSPLTHYAVAAERLADASVDLVASVGLTRARAASAIALARATADGSLGSLAPGADPERTAEALIALPGIGEWSAQYITMRALHWPDAFPSGDLVLRKASGAATPARLRQMAEAWRPWRAYAAMHLWFAHSDHIRKTRTP